MKFFLTLLLLITHFNVAAGAANESVEYRYYEISPRAPHEIKPELRRNSPIRSYDGHTDWYVDWKYQTLSSPYGCQLRDSRINVRVIYMLPKLSQYVSDKQTIDTFTKFGDALTQHEAKHGLHGLTAAREIAKAFETATPQRNCRQMSRMLNDIGNTIVRKYAQKDVEYDRATNHGLTEGAVIY